MLESYKRFVITVAPQKYICAQNKTYPISAVAIHLSKPSLSKWSLSHVCLRVCAR